MDERGSNNRPRDLLERLFLAGFGAVALSADRLDAVADELSRVGGVRRDEARAAQTRVRRAR